MEFVDTHCHIHFDNYPLDAEAVYNQAVSTGVTRLVVVGCTLQDSEQGVAFAQSHEGVYAAVGIHPHEAQHYVSDDAHVVKLGELAKLDSTIAIGECGLDYYYNHSPKDTQRRLLEQQLQVAQDQQLPVLFHVRDAFDDFFSIINNFPDVSGVVHSFTAGNKILKKVLNYGLYVGLNGIITFTKDDAQLAMAKHVPLEKLVLETDAPFLTPEPLRGTVCEPRHLVETARFLAHLRGESVEALAKATTDNARIALKLL